MSRRKQANPKPLLKSECQDSSETISTEDEGTQLTSTRKNDIIEQCESSEVQDEHCRLERKPSTSETSCSESANLAKPSNKPVEDRREVEQPKLRINTALASDPALHNEAKDLNLVHKELTGDESINVDIDPTQNIGTEIFHHIKVFTCHPCGIGFSTLSTLEAHQAYYCSHRKSSETEETSVKLSELEFSAVGETSSKAIKTGKQYACSQCSYSADKKVSLNRHMRMHQPSPVAALTAANGEDTSSQNTDRYCSECDIHFSNIKTYRAHKQHYCHSRRMDNTPSTANTSILEQTIPAQPKVPTKSFLALPTNPLLIIPYSLFRMASILPELIASSAGEMDNCSSTCFLYENGAMRQIATAVDAASCDKQENTESLPADELPLLFVKETDVDAINQIVTKVCLAKETATSEPSAPLDLSFRKSPLEILTTDKHPLTNNDQIGNFTDILLKGSEQITNPERLKTTAGVLEITKSPKKCLDVITRLQEESKSSKEKLTKVGCNSESSSAPINSTMGCISTASPPQIYVKQGVSKCKECNIVFCKHENYLAHKQHYCSARSKDDTDAKATADSPTDTQPRAYQQLICAACGIKYTSLDNLRTHQSFYCPKGADIQATNEKNHCNKCTKTHENGRCALGESSLKCPVCDVIIENVNERKKHLEAHGSIKAFKCLICNYKGNTLRGMRTHIRMHFDKKLSDFSEEKYMSCITEEERKDSTPNVVASSAIQQQENFKCDICAFTTIYKENLIKHMARHHSPKFPAITSILSIKDVKAFGQNGDIASCISEGRFGVRAEIVDTVAAAAAAAAATTDETNEFPSLKHATTTEDTVANDPNLSTLASSSSAAAASIFPLKYCETCDIRFKYMNSYVAHKKFYCKRISSDDSNNSEFRQLSPTMTSSAGSVETVL